MIRYDKNFRSFQKLKERNDFFGLVPKPTKWLVQSGRFETFKNMKLSL